MKLKTLLSAKAKKKIEDAHNKAIKNYDRAPNIMLTIMGFEAIHSVGRNNCNNESGLVQLLDRHFEIKDLHVVKEKGLYSFYVKYNTISNPQGFTDLAHINHGFNYILSIRKGNITKHITFNLNQDNGEFEFPYFLDELALSATNEKLTPLRSWDFDDIIEGKENSPLLKLLTLTGWKVLKVMEYNERIWLRPEYVKIKGTSIEFGVKTNHTYHSLPKVYLFDLLPKVKTVELADLGVETPGYYDHHSRHFIKESDVDKVKSFNARFSRNVK